MQRAAAVIPGIPDARFWSDSERDFLAVLPATAGPWLCLSTGGGDGAFGAGLLNGWSESGKRPEFSVVTAGQRSIAERDRTGRGFAW